MAKSPLGLSSTAGVSLVGPDTSESAPFPYCEWPLAKEFCSLGRRVRFFGRVVLCKGVSQVLQRLFDTVRSLFNTLDPFDEREVIGTRESKCSHERVKQSHKFLKAVIG